MGPSMDPCGTPKDNIPVLDRFASIGTNWDLWLKSLEINLSNSGEKPSLCSLVITLLWAMVSNALEKSTNVTKVTSLT